MLRVFNTLTREKEVFKSQKPNLVNMYVCGPTVYNYIHIGNARSIVAFDTIRRYFEYRGYQVNYVSNFTDVDDKLINEARREQTTVPEIAARYIDAFKADVAQLNVEPATVNPKASDNIPEIIAFIQNLIDKGYAYEAAGNVYYRARKFKNYGQLSDQNIDELEQGASQHVETEELSLKEDPIDFAMWKAAKPDEIFWEAPWGKGRPGWHIECSVMSIKYLGQTLDIHGGGQDLEFPHHENEIAQSEAETGQKFANYWLHNGFVTIGSEDEKMSKSLGNFVTVHDFVAQSDPQILRFLMATTQYRRPIRYCQESLDDAQANLNKLSHGFINLDYRFKDAVEGHDTAVETDAEAIQTAFIAAMDDDFNAQNGIMQVYELVKLMNQYTNQAEVKQETLTLLKQLFLEMTNVFGLKFATDSLLDDEIEAMIQARNDARKNKDFAKSDAIRDELKTQGIILEDTPQGTRWHRE
ncbi:cysteine--tRNA ligase [Agrilactobacillus yilanensis]|uniref:Cysteine--tRNA ligase n=1 Tax=Agrilactobacillus yilanensis TaxID=2485997 RepID=A0ABW4J9L8_9LACO|nr:cysteine--tRNA ligase [Agrilactobacillus yilanensis]